VAGDRKSRRPHCQTGGTARVTIRRAFDQGIGSRWPGSGGPARCYWSARSRACGPANYCPLRPRRLRAADRTHSFPSPDRRRTLSRSGFCQGLPEGPPLGALDRFRSAQTMISAGDGTPGRHVGVGFRGFMPERQDWLGGPARAAAGRACRRPAGAGHCRGRGWSAARRGRFRTKAERADRQRRGPRRAHRARLPVRAAQFTPNSDARQRAPGSLAPPGARRALRALDASEETPHPTRAHGSGHTAAGAPRHGDGPSGGLRVLSP